MSWPAKDPEETKAAVFDFVNEVEAGVALVSVQVVATVFQGTDPTPGNVVLGAAVINGTQAVQRLTAGLDGCDYKLRAKGTDASGLVHVISEILPVRSQ